MEKSDSHMKELVHHEMKIAGMHCASCVANVEKSLKHLTGVHSASVNLVTESASIDYNSKIIQIDELKQAVESIGYKVQDNVVTKIFRIENMHCASCVANVEKTLSQTDGVEEAIDWARLLVRISCFVSRTPQP